jgi:hypothetical protein
MHELQITRHAENRQAQRSLSLEDIRFVWEHGRRVRCAGALHIFLGKRDIPAERDVARRFDRLEGTTLVMDDTRDELVLITAYRNRRGFKQIRAKRKYEHCRAAIPEAA